MSILKYFQSVSQSQDFSPSQSSPASVDELSIAPTHSTDSRAHAASTSQDEDGELERSTCTPPSPKQCRTETAPNSHDLARCIGSAMCLSDAEKYELLANHFRPDANYRFPKSTTGRALSFLHRWMQLQPWLAYSEQKNAGFCTLLATSGHHGSELGILVQRPLVSFSKSLEVLSKHAMKDYHKVSSC